MGSLVRSAGFVPAAPIEEEVVSVGDPSEFDAIEQELLDRVKEASVDTVKRPGFDVWPGFGQLQLVGLNTWFKVDDEAWIEDVEVYQELSFERLTAIGDPERVEYEFADGVRFCRRQGVDYSPAADRSLSCSRGWDHTTEVEPQRVRARLVYEFQWELAEEVDGGGSRQITASGDYLIVGDWSDWNDLTVGELGTVASDGTGASQVRPDREDGVETLEAVVEDNSCGYNIFCHGARAAVAIWKWGADAWDALSSGLLEVAHTIWNLARGCFANVVDVFIALKDMISKVRALHDDPVQFIRDQIDVIRSMKDALLEDPTEFILELAGGAIELDLYEANRTQWIGKFACQLAVALFTGGGSLFAKFGSAARLVEKITDFLASRGRPGRLDADAIPDGPRRDRDGRDDDNVEDGDELGTPTECRTRGNSFPTGTQVRLAAGSLLAIEDVRPGDTVLAADPLTGEWSGELVLDQWSHVDDGRMITVVLSDRSRVTATDHHRFWVASDGAWLELEDVAPGDLLLTPTGMTRVAAVIGHPIAENLVWELDTAGPNTFTVNTGSVDVLVHNCGDFTPPGEVDTDDLFPDIPGSQSYRNRLIEYLLERERRRAGDDFDEEAARARILESLVDHQVHHLLPKQLANHPLLARLGIDINDPQNLRPLPCRGAACDNPLHQNHPRYSEAVNEMLDRIEGSNLTDGAKQGKVAELLESLHEGLAQDNPLAVAGRDDAVREAWIEFLSNEVDLP